jgi:hypothetical protein
MSREESESPEGMPSRIPSRTFPCDSPDVRNLKFAIFTPYDAFMIKQVHQLSSVSSAHRMTAAGEASCV